MNELHDKIKGIAYELYLKRGMIDGYDIDDWLEAEKMVIGSNNSEIGKKENGQTKKSKKLKKAGGKK
jgi:hypothetical protein